jgi:hypothetical protein
LFSHAEYVVFALFFHMPSIVGWVYAQSRMACYALEQWESVICHFMTLPAIKIDEIQARRKANARLRAEIRHQIDILDQQMQALEHDEINLAAIERALSRNEQDQPIQAVGEIVARLVGSVSPQAERFSRKPSHLPSVVEMARLALQAPQGEAQKWLSAAEITEIIKNNWWPDVSSDFIGPQLWRAAKRGALTKEGMRYALLAPSSSASKQKRPSQSNPAGPQKDPEAHASGVPDYGGSDPPYSSQSSRG